MDAEPSIVSNSRQDINGAPLRSAVPSPYSPSTAPVSTRSLAALQTAVSSVVALCYKLSVARTSTPAMGALGLIGRLCFAFLFLSRFAAVSPAPLMLVTCL